MRAILINPELKQVTEIEVSCDYKEIYEIISCDVFSCPVTYDNNDCLYCDDEGLFKPQKGGIIMKNWYYPILGKILILGTNEDGESADAKTDIRFFENQITWLNEAQAERYRSLF